MGVKQIIQLPAATTYTPSADVFAIQQSGTTRHISGSQLPYATTTELSNAVANVVEKETGTFQGIPATIAQVSGNDVVTAVNVQGEMVGIYAIESTGNAGIIAQASNGFAVDNISGTASLRSLDPDGGGVTILAKRSVPTNSDTVITLMQSAFDETAYVNVVADTVAFNQALINHPIGIRIEPSTYAAVSGSLSGSGDLSMNAVQWFDIVENRPKIDTNTIAYVSEIAAMSGALEAMIAAASGSVGSGVYLPLAGGTVTGATIFRKNLSSPAGGTGNEAFGDSALISMKLGGGAGQLNTAVGANALFSNQTGSGNTSVGYGAIAINDGLSNNTALGFQCGAASTASNSTYIGWQAGYSNARDNTLIVANASTSASPASANALIYGEYDTGVVHIKGARVVTSANISGFTVSGDITRAEVAAISAGLAAVDATKADISTVAAISAGLDTRVDNLEAIGEDTGEPTGFVNRTSSSLNFNDATRTFTITGTYDVYVDGVKFTKTGETQVINDTHGMHFFYYDPNGTFTYSDGTAWSILAPDAMIAAVYWDKINQKGILIEERHGSVMDAATHYYNHSLFGTQRITAGAIGGYTIQTDTDPAIQLTVGQSTLADEDIIYTTVSGITSGSYRFVYRTGATAWEVAATNNVPYLVNGNSIRYNQLSGSNYVLSDITTNDQYVNYYIVASTAVSGAYSYVLVPGQQTYSSLALAQGATFNNLNLTNFPFIEFNAIYQLTFRFRSTYGTTGRARLEAEPVLLGLRSATQSVAPASNHNSLSGLQGGTTNEYFHLTSAQISDLIGRTEVAAISAGLVAYDAAQDAAMSGALVGLIDAKANQATTVSTTGNQTIDGTKSFIGTTYFGNTAIATNSIEVGLNRTSAGSAFIDMHAVSGSDYSARILRDTGTNGILHVYNTGNGGIQIHDVSNTKFDSLSTSAGQLINIGTGGGLQASGINTTSISGYTMLDRPMLVATRERIQALGNVAGSINLDLSLANSFTMTPTSPVTATFINPPANLLQETINVLITQPTATRNTVRFMNSKWSGGAVPIPTSGGVDLYTLTTFDGGTSYIGEVKTTNLQPGAYDFNATGGTIITSGAYKIHRFTSSGTFSVTGTNNVEVLVVGGGGAGGNGRAGGGGGGAVVYNSSYAVANENITVTVGAGGDASITWSANCEGTSGGNSVFGTIVAVGGGVGMSYDNDAAPTRGHWASGAAVGGCGGGGAGFGSGTNNGQLALVGYAGGAANTIGAGGGGMGSVGMNATTVPGSGGAGVAYAMVPGVTAYYGAGGGGGDNSSGVVALGGSGVGGNGGSSTPTAPTAGAANTGSGGGGGNLSTFRGGNGGSGVVIVRYLI